MFLVVLVALLEYIAYTLTKALGGDAPNVVLCARIPIPVESVFWYAMQVYSHMFTLCS